MEPMSAELTEQFKTDYKTLTAPPAPTAPSAPTATGTGTYTAGGPTAKDAALADSLTARFAKLGFAVPPSAYVRACCVSPSWQWGAGVCVCV